MYQNISKDFKRFQEISERFPEISKDFKIF